MVIQSFSNIIRNTNGQINYTKAGVAAAALAATVITVIASCGVFDYKMMGQD